MKPKTFRPRTAAGISLLLFLLFTFLLPAPALARDINFDDKVDEGEVLDQNLILTGTEVSMDGEINGDLIAIGDEVTINGSVDGSLITAGNRVILNGPVTGNVLISALTLVLGPEASIGKDVYFVGGTLKTQDSSTVSRDLNIISLESELTGSVSRDINALVGPLNMIQVILNFAESRGWLPESDFLDNLGWLPQAKPVSGLYLDKYQEQAVLEMGFGLSSLHKLVSIRPAYEAGTIEGTEFRVPAQTSTIDVERLKQWAIPLLRNLAALLILGLLAVWLVPAQLIYAREKSRRQPWRALMTGLFVFIFGWFIAFLVFVLVILLAVFLIWVSLPGLGFLVGTLGLTSLGLAVTVFWFSIAFFSKLVVASLIGAWFFKAVKIKRTQSLVWPLITGVVFYALLASIPYLGWLVAVISTLFGLGALWFLIAPHELLEESPVSEPVLAVENPEVGLAPEG